MDKNKLKIIRGLIVFTVVLVGILIYIPNIINIMSGFCKIMSPIFLGLIVAFILNAPITIFEKLFSKIKIRKKPLKEKTIVKLSVFLTVIILAVLIFLIYILVIPNIISSVPGIIDQIQTHWPEWMDFLEGKGIDTTQLQKFFTEIDIEKFTNQDGILFKTLDTASSVVKETIMFLISMIIAFYALIDKKRIGGWAKKIIIAFAPQKAADRTLYFAQKIKESYFDFFTGQCIESVILGSLMFLTLTIFRIPYAGIIAILTALFAFVPYIGAWFACGVGCILMLVSDPNKIIPCVAVYFVTQMFENYVIYPHVVGNKVSLSPLVTLAAVIIGGSLFGLVGMIFFIPFVAVVRDALKEKINERIEKKEKIPTQNE